MVIGWKAVSPCHPTALMAGMRIVGKAKQACPSRSTWKGLPEIGLHLESGVRGISLRSTQRENLLRSPTHQRCSWLSPRLTSTLPADSPLPLGSIVISWSSDLHLHLRLHCATSQHRRTFDHSIVIVHPNIHALHILLLTSTSTSISDAGQTEPWPPTVGITNFSTRRTHPSIARCQYHTVFCSP